MRVERVYLFKVKRYPTAGLSSDFKASILSKPRTVQGSEGQAGLSSLALFTFQEMKLSHTFPLGSSCFTVLSIFILIDVWAAGDTPVARKPFQLRGAVHAEGAGARRGTIRVCS